MNHPLRASLSSLATVISALALAPVANAQQVAPAVEPAPAPKLVLAIAVDQFSADLFAQYRARFVSGLKRLQGGAVFPSGYQSHAATETCPGHSTLLTGVHPAYNGIIANSWVDLKATRANKKIYCAEDETKVAADPKDYVASAVHLKVPTLGERLKLADPRSRNVAVSGKDRAALMMGGNTIDEVYWLKSMGFATLEGRALTPAAVAANAAVTAELANPEKAFALPADCAGNDRAIVAGAVTVGTGRFAREAGDTNTFRASPRSDAAVEELAERLIAQMNLGGGPATDVLSVSFSATDYIGHSTGTQGSEMCIQMHALDQTIGRLLTFLDKRGVDYAVMLSADHGAPDMTERTDLTAVPHAARADAALATPALAKAIAERLGIVRDTPLLVGDGVGGDIYFAPDLTTEQAVAVLAEMQKIANENPQVAAVFTQGELASRVFPKGQPQDWSLMERARASYFPGRSGDMVMLLNRTIMPIPVAMRGYVSTHGSPWDYDRRVPMLFWRKGLTGFEQPEPVETVDIAPTLAALVGLTVPEGEMDGRCLDLDPGEGNTCG